MINQLNSPYLYNVNEQNCVNGVSNKWDSRKNCILNLKTAMNNHFDINQREKCCFCGLYYDRTGRGELEHIAPKGAGLYPQYTFTPHNIAKACQLCNSSSMKHTYDPITVLNPVYQNCQFSIVHPYLDNHNDHYKWNYGLLNVLISVNNNSSKGIKSIELFELASEKRTRARAIQRNQERLENIFNIPNNIKRRILSAISI
ncbi:hypothetical protein [Xanthomarina sp. F2636L]|uniref:hypothetical protein n=1 Tax=Xanthomarina sp. F2636L TaxID=2996018 RepID=UPI00225DCEA6|nr:hypothetical protein [Xanthomarina sp. F2636L]MCX7552118.1 hypothetical protein [Xanthomarina sp. F2636L]